MNILVTGAAGFMGMHVAQRLLAQGDTVVGLDNLNDYYSPQLKRDRLAAIEVSPGAERFRFVHAPLEDMAGLAALCQAEQFVAWYRAYHA
jgi:UDP-glucuronate 4-epimerase